MRSSLNSGAALVLPWFTMAADSAGSSEEPTSCSEFSEIVRKAQNGDGGAFEQLMRDHLPFLSREIGKHCPPDALEDIAQNILMRAYQALPDYQDCGSFRWWLKTITTRACLDYWRSIRRSEKIDRAYQETRPQTAKISDETLRIDLERFLSQLSASDRMVFTLAFLEDRPHNEVAELLGISVTATKVRCFRLKQKAKHWFEV